MCSKRPLQKKKSYCCCVLLILWKFLREKAISTKLLSSLLLSDPSLSLHHLSTSLFFPRFPRPSCCAQIQRNKLVALETMQISPNRPITKEHQLKPDLFRLMHFIQAALWIHQAQTHTRTHTQPPLPHQRAIVNVVKVRVALCHKCMQCSSSFIILHELCLCLLYHAYN